MTHEASEPNISGLHTKTVFSVCTVGMTVVDCDGELQHVIDIDYVKGRAKLVGFNGTISTSSGRWATVLDYNHFQPETELERLQRENATMRDFINEMTTTALVYEWDDDFTAGLKTERNETAADASRLLATL